MPVKLAVWAREQGVSYRAALNWFHAGKLPVPARQLPSGTILVDPAPAQIGDFEIETVTWAADSEVVARRTDRLIRVSDPECYRNVGQCSALQGGGEGPRWEGRQGPGSALNRAVLLLDVLLHDAQRCPAHGPGEVRARPQLVGPVVVAHEVGELLPQPPGGHPF